MGCQEWNDEDEEITKVETPKAKRASGELPAVRIGKDTPAIQLDPAIESAADFAARIARHFENALARRMDFRRVSAPGLEPLIESDRAAVAAQARREALADVYALLKRQCGQCYKDGISREWLDANEHEFLDGGLLVAERGDSDGGR